MVNPDGLNLNPLMLAKVLPCQNLVLTRATSRSSTLDKNRSLHFIVSIIPMWKETREGWTYPMKIPTPAPTATIIWITILCCLHSYVSGRSFHRLLGSVLYRWQKLESGHPLPRSWPEKTKVTIAIVNWVAMLRMIGSWRNSVGTVTRKFTKSWHQSISL